MEAGTLGCFFGYDDDEKKNCKALFSYVRQGDMNTIQLNLGEVK